MQIAQIATLEKKHSLYTNVRTLNDGIIKANCSAHIVHNTLKFALGNLNVDIENIVLKIYSHFSMSAKRRETLKEFHIFVETEFHEILRHVPTRWLSLHPCIERILLSWKALSSHFLSRPAECSKQLLKLLMIDNESTEIPRLIEMYLIFSPHVMEIFKLAVQELEKNETLTADFFIILTNLRNRLKSRRDEEFFGYDVHQLLANVGAAEAQEATKDFRLFLNSAIAYLEKKFDFDENLTFGKLSKLSLLDNLFPNYQTLVKIVEHLKLKDKLNLNMDDLFDEVALIQKNFGTIQSTKLFTECKQQAVNGTLC